MLTHELTRQGNQRQSYRINDNTNTCILYDGLHLIKQKFEEEMKMNMDQKLDFYRKAVEMGANISVRFHGIIGKVEAEKLIAEFSQMLDIPYTHQQNTGTYWFSIKDYSEDVNIAVFYDLSKEEKQEEYRKMLEELANGEEEIV